MRCTIFCHLGPNATPSNDFDAPPPPPNPRRVRCHPPTARVYMATEGCGRDRDRDRADVVPVQIDDVEAVELFAEFLRFEVSAGLIFRP